MLRPRFHIRVVDVRQRGDRRCAPENVHQTDGERVFFGRKSETWNMFVEVPVAVVIVSQDFL